MLDKMIRGAAIAAVAAMMMTGHMAMADGHAATGWTLDAGSSKLAFGSVKKETIGEVHSFETISGSVSAQGAVALEIDLTSVQTNIDIRNERFGEFVFNGAPKATLKADVNMAEMSALAIGASDVIDVEAVLSFLGADLDVEAEMFAMRISGTQVMITTNDMIFVGVEDLGITAGVDKLMELAKLSGITRTTPVTLRLIFNMDEKKAEAAPAAPVLAPVLAPVQVAAASGDVDAGKKVFKKCKACHRIKAGKNGAGPTLHNVIGAPAGAVDGFNYSEAMAGSGLVWDAETLSAFLAKPKAVVKGTTMIFKGLKKDADIANVIAYIASEAG